MNTDTTSLTRESVHTQYVRNETCVAVVINALLSAAFTYLMFHGRSEIPLWGADGVAVDFLPQTFMIVLMTVLVSTLLTRRRVRRAKVAALVDRAPLMPRNVILRGALAALAATIVLAGIIVAVLSLTWGGPYSLPALLLLKVSYGFAVAAIVAPLSLREALRDAR